MVSCDVMHYPQSRGALLIRLLGVGLLALGVVFLVLTLFHAELAEPFLRSVDISVQAAVHRYTGTGLTRSMLALTWVGSPRFLVVFVPLIAACLWWRSFHREAALLLIATIGAGILNTGLKLHFRRVRPDVAWAMVEEHSFSFPSGHSDYAVVLYGMLAYCGLLSLRPAWERAAGVLLAVAMILGIGGSRIYLGAHYPTDVAAGYFTGCVWLLTVVGLDRYERRSETDGTG